MIYVNRGGSNICMSKESNDFDRRSVLKNLGVAAGAVLGVAGTAAADDVGPAKDCDVTCHKTNDICQVGPVYTYRVERCCLYADGSYECEQYYQCGCSE